MSQIKVFLAMTGLDPNNKRIRLMARHLKDATGVKVYYSGMYKSLQENAAEAVRLKVDLLGLSIYTGLHLTVFPEMRQALDEAGGQHIVLFGEGLIPVRDADFLQESGFASAVFSSTVPIKNIVDWIKDRPAS